MSRLAFDTLVQLNNEGVRLAVIDESHEASSKCFRDALHVLNNTILQSSNVVDSSNDQSFTSCRYNRGVGLIQKKQRGSDAVNTSSSNVAAKRGAEHDDSTHDSSAAAPEQHHSVVQTRQQRKVPGEYPLSNGDDGVSTNHGSDDSPTHSLSAARRRRQTFAVLQQLTRRAKTGSSSDDDAETKSPESNSSFNIKTSAAPLRATEQQRGFVDTEYSNNELRETHESERSSLASIASRHTYETSSRTIQNEALGESTLNRLNRPSNDSVINSSFASHRRHQTIEGTSGQGSGGRIELSTNDLSISNAQDPGSFRDLEREMIGIEEKRQQRKMTSLTSRLYDSMFFISTMFRKISPPSTRFDDEDLRLFRSNISALIIKFNLALSQHLISFTTPPDQRFKLLQSAITLYNSALCALYNNSNARCYLKAPYRALLEFSILNNMGALHYQLGNIVCARHFFQRLESQLNRLVPTYPPLRQYSAGFFGNVMMFLRVGTDWENISASAA